MKTQKWFCEGCGAEGSVDYQEHADVLTVYNNIMINHAKVSPGCEKPQEVRVINDAMATN